MANPSTDHDLTDAVSDKLDRQRGEDHTKQTAQDIITGSTDQILDAVCRGERGKVKRR